MKILFVTNGYPTKHNPEYCVFNKDQIDSVLSTKNIEGEVFFINAREKGIFEYIRSILPLKKKIPYYDIIHVFHGLTLIFVFLLAPTKKIIVSFLNNIENEYKEKSLFSPILKKITKSIITKDNITKIYKDKLPDGFCENSYYLPNGVDTKRFYTLEKREAKKILNLEQNLKYILFVSSKNRFRKQKRYDKFKHVIQILKKDYSEVEELVLENEPHDKTVYYYNAAELHLITSDYEGSPNSVKEAIACNRAVVATDTGNIRWMLNDIPGCYVAKSFSVFELANLCKKVLSSNSENQELRTYIYKKRLDLFSKARELIDIYEKILKC